MVPDYSTGKRIMKNITEEEYLKLKTKAEKWDALDDRIATFYSSHPDEEGDLIDIGEAAAEAFGYL